MNVNVLSYLRAILCVPQFVKYITVKIHLAAELEFFSQFPRERTCSSMFGSAYTIVGGDG